MVREVSARVPGDRGPVIAIVGPTASGKTALSIDVARALDGEIISMDSRQVYRRMNVGTAKASASQQQAVPHHGLDLAEPDERFSAGRFARMARQRIDAIRERGHVPMLVGGTGFFLRALTNPIFREPEMEPDRRRALQAYLEGLPPERLRAWLERLDPEAAERLSGSGGRQRVLRALEMPLLTGQRLSWWHRHGEPEAAPLRPLVFVLDLPREQLYGAINRRVDDMVTAGLVDEVRDLVAAGYDERSPGMNATGYIELLPFLRGEVPLDEALDRIRANTRAYARRQLTWFRHQLPQGAVWLDAARPRSELVSEVVERWRSEAGVGAGRHLPRGENGSGAPFRAPFGRADAHDEVE